MSFILDALRRAETQRGNQPAAIAPDSALLDIADKPSAMPSRRFIALSAIVAIALFLVAMNFFNQPEPNATGMTSSGNRMAQQTRSQPAPFPTLAPDTPLADVATAAEREVRPLNREARTASSRTSSNTGTAAPTDTASTPVRPGTVSYSQEPLSASDTPARAVGNVSQDNGSLPSYAETVLIGGAQLPQFHLDMHVFAANPDRRFVFVNNRKYREGQQLDEGGTVERITPAGVVLNHRGRRFELLPD